MNSIQMLATIVLLLIVLICYIGGTVAESGLAVHFVPSTSKSIRRFPEADSPYADILKDFSSIELNRNETDILVSARGYVFRMDLESFKIENTSISENVLRIPVDNEKYGLCVRNRIDKNDCWNYIVLALYNGTSDIFACGTYALLGKCWLIDRDTLKMIRIVKGDWDFRNQMAPTHPNGKIVGLTTKNHAIFASMTNKKTGLLRAILSDGIKMKSGRPEQFKAPNFVYAYEADDNFVYFFFTETAEEVSERQMVYSRVGRVCTKIELNYSSRKTDPNEYAVNTELNKNVDKRKMRVCNVLEYAYISNHHGFGLILRDKDNQYDRGSGYLEYDTFITFSKSQIVCYKQGSVNDYYDHIQTATAIEVHDQTGKSEVYIYASFTTTIRSTGSSAICRYKLKDIQKLFQTSQYYVRTKDSKGNVKYEAQNHPKPIFDVSRMTCNASLKTEAVQQPSFSTWITAHPLLYDDIIPLDKNTVATFRGERVTSLAVEDIHKDVNKTDVGKHVLFVGTGSGKIFKVVMNSTNVGEPVFVEEIQAVEGSGAITLMILHKKYIIATGRTIKMIRVEKERCESMYLMCSDCLKARDPFCAWSISQKKCTRAADISPSERLQDVERGSDNKCPAVDVNISCSLTVVDNYPGAWTALQCTGYGKIPPKVVAWKKDKARLDVDKSVYEIRHINESSQLLIIKGYSVKELGTYGCVVGLERNKSECTIPVEGEKPEVNCLANATNCSCAVTGYPFPSVRKFVQGNYTVKIGQSGPITINPGVVLFAFNSFGDAAFSCPVVMVPTVTTTTTTTTRATTTTRRTTTTILPTTASTTQTTTFRKSTKATTPTTVPTAKPTTVTTPGKTEKPQTTKRETTTSQRKTTKISKPMTTQATTTRMSAPTPGKKQISMGTSCDRFFVPFLICLLLLILLIGANLLFFLRRIIRKRKLDAEEGDEIDGKSGTLKISPTKEHKRLPTVTFHKGPKVTKSESTKPLVKKELDEPQNGSAPNHIEKSKLATEMDDSGSGEISRYIAHIKT